MDVNKKLIIADLDGTLAQSKSAISLEMAELLEELLKKYSVAVISGGAYSQFQRQFLKNLVVLDSYLERLYLFPTCATSFYRFEKEWIKVYSQDLSTEDKDKILKAFSRCFEKVGFSSKKKYGEIIEDRGSQITFSGLGQEAPIEIKKFWDPKLIKRLEMVNILLEDLPDFDIKIGGTTSIDITHKNIDKAYGITQIEKYLGFNREEMLFIGDSLFKGGNDYAVRSTGVECIETSGPQETQIIIQTLLN